MPASVAGNLRRTTAHRRMFSTQEHVQPTAKPASRLRESVALIVLLAVHAGLLGRLAYVHSPTTSETAHLPAGISHWTLGRFDLYRVNPPLVRMVAALPVLWADPATDWQDYDLNPINRPEYVVGSAFVEANGPRAFWLYTLGRWACIPFSLIGAFFCCRWARDLYGVRAGFVACAFWCFCPNVLGHGSLIMPDIPAAAFGCAACYMFWRWLKRTDWTNAVVMGMVLGVAELTKTTLILLYFLWPLLYLLYRLPTFRMKTPASIGDLALAADRSSNPGKGEATMPMTARNCLSEVSMLATALFLSIVVINAGYCFEGSFQRLGDYAFRSRCFSGRAASEFVDQATGNRFAGTWLASIPVPLPANYLQGLDTQKVDLEGGKMSYLAGTWSDHGWWYFYLFAAAIKEPLGVWLASLLAALTVLFGWKSRAEWRDELLLFIPVGLFVFVVSAHTGFTTHFRYVFPALPFAFVLASRWAADFGRVRSKMVWIGTAAILWMMISSLSVCPHSLSYFNELVGGPSNGPKYLLHSNCDWGQDLLHLKRWIDEHPEARGMRVAFLGAYDPAVIGLTSKILPAGVQRKEDANPPSPNRAASAPPTGWYAVSVHLLYDYHNQYRCFWDMNPTAMAGYSILIYHLTPEQDRAARRELNIPDPPHHTGTAHNAMHDRSPAS